MKKEVGYCCKTCEATAKWLQKHGQSVKGFNEWDEGWSIVEERANKCVINVQRMGFLGRKDDSSLDKQLGLIGIIMLHGIPNNRAYLSKKRPVLCFDFPKKYTKKIRSIEEKFFSGKMQVDAKQMSMAIMTVVNHLLSEDIVTVSRSFVGAKKRK